MSYADNPDNYRHPKQLPRHPTPSTLSCPCALLSSNFKLYDDSNFSSEIDEFSDMSFAITGRKEMTTFIGNPYVSLIAHPGMVLFTPKPSISEQINEMIASIGKLWPIFLVNVALIAMAGIAFAALVRN